MLKMASRINGINNLVFNKMDVLDSVQRWCIYDGPNIYEFNSREDMEYWISGKISLEIDKNIELFFSGDKEKI